MSNTEHNIYKQPAEERIEHNKHRKKEEYEWSLTAQTVAVGRKLNGAVLAGEQQNVQNLQSV